MSGSGYIRAYRSIVDSWEHRHNPLMVAAWLYILMRTAWDEHEEDGVMLHPGEVIVSKGMLAKQYGLTLRQAAWIIKRLVSSGELELVVSRGSNAPVYRLCNYADYNSQGMSAKWPLERPQKWPQEWPQEWPQNKDKKCEFAAANMAAIMAAKMAAGMSAKCPQISETPTSSEGACARNNTLEEINNKYNIHTCRDATESGAGAPAPPERPAEIPPLPKTAEEVLEIAAKFGYEWKAKDAQDFIYFNRSIGWTVGGRKVEDWRYLIPQWERNRNRRRQ